MKTLFSGLLVLLLLAGCKKEDNVITPTPEKAWKTLTPMPTARYNFGFVECNGLLYAIGGYNANGLNKVEVYDPSTDTWKTKAPMPTARGYFVVASVANKIYAIGGLTGSNLNNITYTNVTEEYDPASDEWTVRSPCPMPTAYNSVLGNQFITGAAANGKIYVVVGSSEGNAPTYIYDPAADTWSDAGLGIGKFNFDPYFSTVTNNSMYITDGTNFLEYLSTDNDWRVLEPFSNSEKKGVCLSSDKENIYAMGGYNIISDDNNHYTITTFSDVGIYNITNSSWTTAPSLKEKRHSAAAIVYNNNLYVAGGAEKQSNFFDIPRANLEVLSLK